MQRDSASAERQICQRAPVVAMDRCRGGVTQGAATRGLRHRHREVERLRLDANRVDVHPGDLWEEQFGEHRLSLQNPTGPSLSLSLSCSSASPKPTKTGISATYRISGTLDDGYWR